MRLTDTQWEAVQPFIPAREFDRSHPGRPFADPRAVLDGVIWVLRTGAQWYALPDCYPPFQTCHRRFQNWVRSGVMRKILESLLEHLKASGFVQMAEAYIDGSFSPAKKGAIKSGKQRKARAPKSWQLQTALVFLSPAVLKMLPPTKSDWLKTLLIQHSRATFQKSLLETKLMTATSWTKDFSKKEELS